MPAGPDDTVDQAPATDDESPPVDQSDTDTGGHSDGDRVVANESAVAASEPADDDTDEWRFSVEDVSDSADDEQQVREAENGDGNVAGSLVHDDTLESGDIDLENAFFVALGVFVIIALIAGAVMGL